MTGLGVGMLEAFDTSVAPRADNDSDCAVRRR
jgi:hypothetical protein